MNNLFKASKNIVFIILAGLLLFGSSSCSNTYFLEEGETLYLGSKVKVVDSTFKKSRRKAMEEELTEIVRPKPNRSFLGLRFRLWVYNMARDPESEIGLRSWLRNKIGEPPVIGADFNIKANENILNNYLQNRGYFSATASGEKNINKKKLKATFTVYPGMQDSIRKINFAEINYGPYRLKETISNSSDKSLLKNSTPYNLDTIIAERERISNILKNQGYYFFNPEYILVKADTAPGPHKIDLSITLKNDEIPEKALYPYRINKVTIIPNYQMNSGNRNGQNSYQRPKSDTIYYEQGYGIVERGKPAFKPYVFHQAMQMRPGSYYSLKAQNMALNRLINIGAFRFIKNEFTELDDSSKHLLDLTYYLSPNPKKSLSFDIGAYTQNDNRVGSRTSLSWVNHNTFRGAEVLSVRISGGFDMQYGGEIKTPNIYNLGIDASLAFPKFLVPFIKIRPSSYYVPKTLITTAFNYSLGQEYYRISSLTLGWGYLWKEEATKEHRFFPINLSFVKTDTLNINKANEFNLSNLTFNGIIIGPTYEYTYNSQLGSKARIDNYYFNGKADFSGVLTGLIQGTSLSKPTQKILGVPYAQYAKFETDFRYYHNYSKEKLLATRFFLGLGLPYGNSSSLPNIKQFFSGGSSSLRGFSSRLVGPGSYRFSKQDNNNVYIEMLGDIKLEMNVEYRMPIYQFIKGAVFADAGNIWLYRENPDFPGSAISKDFYKQIAVSAGAGLRFDFSILALRLDLGIPLRKPWYNSGHRWRFDDINPLNKEWRQQNLFFNLAIGYPF